MAKIDDDFSAFDDVANTPDDDFSAFDSVASAPEVKPGMLDRIASTLTPSQGTQELAQDVGEGALDFSKGAAKGLSMNALDELGGAAGAGVEAGLGALGIGPAAVDAQLAEQGFQGAEQPFLEKYRDYQSGIQQDLNAASERSPVLNTLGEIGGGITSGVALGGLLGLGGASKLPALSEIAKNQGMSKAALELLKRGGAGYAKAAPAIAAESALTSQEHLVGPDANPAGVGADVAGGLAFGLPTMLGMQGIQELAVPAIKSKIGNVTSKIAELAEQSPLARQAKIAYEKYGQQFKVNPKNERAIKEGVEGVEGGTPFALLDKNRASGISDDILKKDSVLGAQVGSSLEEATQAGTKIDAQDLVDQTFQQINQLAQEMPSLTKDSNFNSMMSKILSRNYKNASPRDIKNAMDDISNAIERIGGYKTPTPELQDALQFLRPLRKNLDVRLKERVPAYKDAAERFSQYRQTYIEQPIAGGNDPQLDDIYYGSMKKGDKKLNEAYEDLVKRSTSDSQASESTEERYAKLLQKTREFQDSEKARQAAGKISSPITEDPTQFMQKIKDYADDAAVRRSTRDTETTQAGGGLLAKKAAGFSNTGRGFLLGSSYLAGRATSSELAQNLSKMSRNVYRAPAQSLSNLATKLESSPGFSAVGKALREGLENNDGAKRNAALFTIMQNPNSRAFISAEDFPDEEQE